MRRGSDAVSDPQYVSGMTVRSAPAIEGWFTDDPEPALLGTRCSACGTVFFPRAEGLCRNPGCFGRDLVEHRLSNRGRIWSYTDARYQPPPPYVVPGDEHEPFCLVAVELEEEAMVVMGQVVDGISIEDLEVGMPVRLVIDTLFVDPDAEGGPVRKTVWKWEPAYGEGALDGR
jgi:uncharacterized OB-fold protein